MNGRKILNNLIVLFLTLNAILFIINLTARSQEYFINEERIVNVKGLLKQKGIDVKCNVDQEYTPKKQGNIIYIGSDIADREYIINLLFKDNRLGVKRYHLQSSVYPGEQVKFYASEDEIIAFDKYEIKYMNNHIVEKKIKGSEHKAISYCEDFIERIGESINSYKLTSKEANPYGFTIKYEYLFEGIPVEELYIEFKVYYDGIKEATLYLGNIEEIGNEVHDIYPIDLVLFGIENELLENGYNEINTISLVYKVLEKEDNIWGEQIIPMYKIQVDGLESTLFVNAYTNELVY